MNHLQDGEMMLSVWVWMLTGLKWQKKEDGMKHFTSKGILKIVEESVRLGCKLKINVKRISTSPSFRISRNWILKKCISLISCYLQMKFRRVWKMTDDLLWLGLCFLSSCFFNSANWGEKQTVLILKNRIHLHSDSFKLISRHFMNLNWPQVQNPGRSITAACLERHAHPPVTEGTEGTYGQLKKQMSPAEF